jgi:restriction endonuclease S subunit
MGHEVAAFKIPLPSTKDQTAITEVAVFLDQKERLYQAKQEQLQELFETLLARLMSTGIRVDIDATRDSNRIAGNQ